MMINLLPRTEKLLKYALGALGMAFVALMFHAILLDRIEQSADVPVYPSIQTRTSHQQRLSADDLNDQKKTLSGSVILLSEDHSFIRLSVKGEAIYSIGISADTKIIRDGVASDIATLDPFAQVVVLARNSSASERYDFVAESMEISGTEKMTIENPGDELPQAIRIFTDKM